ncbi:MAG: hypothetical protein KC425_18960 [Anaerolineales bacterium]|nr:hypothetical protein [Anaerolineales bacterium]
MSTESRKEVLDLLAEGKISVDEAADMLASVKEATAVSAAPPPAPEPEPTPEPEPVAKPAAAKSAANGDAPKWFRVRVSNLETGQNRVSVSIPLRMLKFGFTIASHFSPEVGSIKMEELQEMLKEGERGVLVDVRDEDSKEHVQVYLE